MDAMTSFDYPLPAGHRLSLHSQLAHTVSSILSGSSRKRTCGNVSDHGFMWSIGGRIYVCVGEGRISGRGRCRAAATIRVLWRAYGRR